MGNLVNVLGAPIFGNAPSLGLHCPLGQLDLVRAVRAETAEPRELWQRLAMEHANVMFSMKQMGHAPRVIRTAEHLVPPGFYRGVEKAGFALASFPDVDPQALGYPRDFCTVLPDSTILAEGAPHTFILKKKGGGERVIWSPLGQGGRILIRRDVALVGNVTFVGKRMERTSTRELEASGLRVGVLPSPVAFEDYGDEFAGLVPEDHIDRVCGLFEGRDGQLHLVLDPELYTGYRDPFQDPRFGPGESIANYRHVCEPLGIEVHVLRTMHIPGSVNFHQFPGGEVLLTSGEDELAEIVAGQVGEDKVLLTPQPIRYMPARAKAGIRCLIGEFPEFLLES